MIPLFRAVIKQLLHFFLAYCKNSPAGALTLEFFYCIIKLRQIGFEEVGIAHDNRIDRLGELQSTVYCELLPDKFVNYIK